MVGLISGFLVYSVFSFSLEVKVSMGKKEGYIIITIKCVVR